MPEFKVVSELKPNMRHINLKFKVVSVSNPREVVSRKDGLTHRVAEAIVGDETGIVTMTLWDDSIDIIEPGKSYQLTNAFMSLFKNRMRLNMGRQSELSEIDEDINVNTEKDMSAREYPKVQRKGYYRERRGRRRKPYKESQSRFGKQSGSNNY